MRSRCLGLGVGLLLVIGAAPARADYKEAYRRGMQAIDQGKWAEAAQRMNEALAEQSREGEQVKLYGLRFETYLPHYYLGLALFNAGNCEAALGAWNTSESQGAVKGSNQYKTLLKNRQACQAKVVKASPSAKPAPGPDPAAVSQAVQAAEAEIARADETGRAVAALATSPELSKGWSADTALGGAEKAGREALDSARAKIDAGRKKPDLALLAEARDLAARAAQQLEAVRALASTRRTAALNTKKTPESLPSPEIRPTASAAPVAPSAELVAGAQAYFNGDYQRASDLLARLPAATGRTGAQALLLRGAARYALFLVGGEQDQALRTAAQGDVEACRRLDPGLVPHRDFFSPRFRDFFSTTR
jgi:hypothetical protein